MGLARETCQSVGLTFSEPDYVDTAPPVAGAVPLWKDRAIYLQGDEPFGQWSDVAEITVRG